MVAGAGRNESLPSEKGTAKPSTSRGRRGPSMWEPSDGGMGKEEDESDEACVVGARGAGSRGGRDTSLWEPCGGHQGRNMRCKTQSRMRRKPELRRVLPHHLTEAPQSPPASGAARLRSSSLRPARRDRSHVLDQGRQPLPREAGDWGQAKAKMMF